MLLQSLCLAISIVATLAVPHGPSEHEHSPSEHEHSPPEHEHGPSEHDKTKSHSDITQIFLCDKYSDSILGSNTPTNQRLLMTLFVNTALVGNYTTPNTGVRVNGIIWPGHWQGEPIDLMPWFNGALASSNPYPEDSGHGISVNWLDGGGPDALRQNLTSFEQGTNQFFFITHLHQYFGYLFGCSSFGTTFDRYNGSTDMVHIHKYMAYNFAQEQYTNLQFFLSALSLGFEQKDARQIWGLLGKLFTRRCQAPISVPKWALPALQSICLWYDCPVAEPELCEGVYDEIVLPQPAGVERNVMVGNVTVG